MIYNVEYHGDMRDWPEFDDLPPLTAIGVADDPSKKSKGLVSYERRSSFAPWIRKEWIMGIAIKISY